MTNNEYQRLLRAARKSYPRLTRETMTELRKIYIKAGNLAAAAVREAERSGMADLTVRSWEAITQQLEAGSTLIVNDLADRIPATVISGVGRTNRIHERYIWEAVKAAGADDRISRVGVHNLYTSVNDRVIRSLVNRMYQDGYTLSDRVWRVGRSYRNQIREVIGAGLSQNRDLVKVAKDVQVYVADGKVALANRFGQLERGTSDFMRRIGNKVDWRALRLVRSELYSSLQEASKEQGHMNPGSTDMYDWVLEVNRQQWGCTCPDLAAAGPYAYQDVPGYPHSNCQCDIRPVMRNGNDFVSDLKSWVSGERVGYLDDWYRQYYTPVA